MHFLGPFQTITSLAAKALSSPAGGDLWPPSLTLHLSLSADRQRGPSPYTRPWLGPTSDRSGTPLVLPPTRHRDWPAPRPAPEAPSLLVAGAQKAGVGSPSAQPHPHCPPSLPEALDQQGDETGTRTLSFHYRTQVHQGTMAAPPSGPGRRRQLKSHRDLTGPPPSPGTGSVPQSGLGASEAHTLIPSRLSHHRGPCQMGDQPQGAPAPLTPPQPLPSRLQSLPTPGSAGVLC